ncbi:hypothetical protein DL96DRAFT_1704811 [Flagelloscypha sp. PMI_526]|nr:hypothetical protein DL96DRAFT_1704811 [Flagelloscypha sp. PMI_526]
MASTLDSDPPSPKEASKPPLDYPPSPRSMASISTASSSRLSLNQADDENVTVTANRLSKAFTESKQEEEDLRLLAISTHMTELSYAISDMQTRIFEIQELRHKSQSGDVDAAGTTSTIDQSLMNLNERIEQVSTGMKTVNASLEPFLQTAATPTVSTGSSTHGEEVAMILRKHATLTSEWTAVQDESEVLKEELKEDKWLTVFRTVTDQADGMMSSLEKAVNRCQDFIWQVQKRTADDVGTGSVRSERAALTLDTFNSLMESFEAKKKHYMPATSKVLSIIDKGVRDRVTKNGETLRRHAESAARWKNLKDRIVRTENDMESVKRTLLGIEATPSEAGSSTSGVSSAHRYLATPSNARSPSVQSSISRSMSPLKKFARKLTSRVGTPVTPLNVQKGRTATPESTSAKTHRSRSSFMSSFRSSQPTTPVTPDRPSHKHSQSVTPDNSPRSNSRIASAASTIKGSTPQSSNKLPWNSSTRVEPTQSPPRRPGSSAGWNPDGNATISTPYKRSGSRASMVSSRPWSPITSSAASTTHSSQVPTRPPSRARTPSRAAPAPPPRAQTPSRAPSRARTSAPPTPARAQGRLAASGNASLSAPIPVPIPNPTPPKPRPETLSHIPGPKKASGPKSDDGSEADGRAFSPTPSSPGGNSPNYYPPRPPSRSMIPLPSLSLQTPSRPGTAMSVSRAESPTMAFRHLATRAQTPESTLKSRLQNLVIQPGSTIRASMSGRSPASNHGPSSYRSDYSASRPPSRSASRMSAHDGDSLPLHEYVPANRKDPLDLEVAAIVNSLSHGLLVERVDPPLKKIPKEGEEVKAQYAFSNAIARKIVTCRLTTLVRSSRAASGESTTTINKKVMCRVGGGWQDLSLYILNRQAGM